MNNKETMRSEPLFHVWKGSLNRFEILAVDTAPLYGTVVFTGPKYQCEEKVRKAAAVQRDADRQISRLFQRKSFLNKPRAK